MVNRRFQQRHAEIDFRPKRLVELLKVRIVQQEGIHFLLEACSFFLRRRTRAVGTGLLDPRRPLGALFIASRQPEVHGKTHRPTDVRAGHRIVRERRGVVALVVMAVDIVEETPHRLT